MRMRALIRKIALGFTTAMFMIGCTSEPPIPEPSVGVRQGFQIQTQRERTNPEGLKNALDSVVEVHVVTINGLRRFGSGFAVANNEGTCVIATALHTIADSGDIKIKTIDNKTLEARLIDKDTVGDVALLITKQSFETKWCKPAKLQGLSNELAREVFLLSNLDNQGISLTHGVVSRVKKFGQDVLIETDAMAGAGSSGGPLVEPDGDCIGMVVQIGTETSTSGTRGRFSYALPANVVSILLKRFSNPNPALEVSK